MTTRALQHEEGQNLIAAIRRLHELENSKIITTNQEAEKAGIINLVKTKTAEHADELLACWSAVRFEYEPLVGSISLFMDRVSSIRRNRMLANQIPAAPPENDTAPLTPDAETASNIVPLK